MTTLVLNPSVDTYVLENTADTAYGSSEEIQVNTSAGSRRIGLLIFDLSSIAGATINSASLSLYNVFTSGSNRNFPLYAILSANNDWITGATWNFADGSADRWAGDTGNDGGTDAGCSVSGTDYNGTSIGTIAYTASSPQDTELIAVLTTSVVQAWADGNNYGLIVLGSDAATRSFRSNDYGTEANRPKLTIDYTAAGGTTYNQSASGGVAPTSTLLNQTQKAMGGSITPGASLFKQSQRALAGTVAPTGTLLNQAQKVSGGALTPGGTLLNQAQKILDGALIPAAVLINQIQKAFTGNVTPTSTLFKQTQKVLSGDIAPSGILTGAKAALISLVGTLTPSGALANKTQKVLGGAVSPLGGLLNQTQKVLSSGIAPSGILAGVKTTLVNLVGALTPSGTLTKGAQKVLGGTLAPLGNAFKQVSKFLGGSVTPSGVLSAVLTGGTTIFESTFKGMFRGMFRRMR